jgi:hypothetical protein
MARFSLNNYSGVGLKIESPAFTQADVDRFELELREHEREALADRLERASARLAAIGPRITAARGADTWSDHEVLAHIAVLSKFYGVMVHKISSGQMTEVDVLNFVNLRDVAGDQTAQQEPADILRAALADQARTLKLLRSIDAVALGRTVRLQDGSVISAEHVARLPLINHLETHVEQLER